MILKKAETIQVKSLFLGWPCISEGYSVLSWTPEKPTRIHRVLCSSDTPLTTNLTSFQIGNKEQFYGPGSLLNFATNYAWSVLSGSGNNAPCESPEIISDAPAIQLLKYSMYIHLKTIALGESVKIEIQGPFPWLAMECIQHF